MKSKTKLIEIIKSQIKEDFIEQIINAIKPSIRLKTTGLNNDSKKISKLGGIPDLPVGFDWPITSYDSFAFSFLAQIKLGEIHKFDLENELPETGFLYFFQDMRTFDSGKVFYFESPKGFYRPSVPSELLPRKNWFQKLFRLKASSKILKESDIEIYNEYHIISPDSLIIENIILQKDKGINRYDILKGEEFYEEIHQSEGGFNEHESNHHLLGNYNAIQSAFEELSCIDYIEGESPKDRIKRGREWKLLFQIDSDNNLNISWGDWGKIYFFIHKDDLKNKNFEKAKATGQCY